MRGPNFLGAWTPDRRLPYTVLVGAVLFWTAYDDGSYSLASRGTIAIALWWAVALGILLGLVSTQSVPRATVLTGGLLAGLAAWTLASVFWSSSAESAFSELDRTTLYLGVYVLVALLASRRDVGLWCNGLALAIVAVAAVALASRLFPGVFPDRGLATFLPSSVTRLSFPLGYWNGLAVFVALGVPLLLRAALVARSVVVRSAALAPAPVLAAVLYLASSRGGVLTVLVGIGAFVALTERRWSAVGATSVAALGAAAAIAVLVRRDALVNGPLGTELVRRQGREAALLIVLACCATGALYWLGCRLLAPRVRLRPWVGAAAIATLVAAVVALVVASHPVRRFDAFKRSPAELSSVRQGDFVRAHLLSGGGSGRWQFWTAAVDQWKQHPLRGLGAGSYEQWWTRHASFTYFVRDAHSLYLETLGELGLVGLALVLALVLTGLVEGSRRALRSAGDVRVTTAALASVFAGYAVAVGLDWMWELTAVSVLGFVALGLVTGPATAVPESPRLVRPAEQPPLAARRRFGIGVATVLIAWAVIGAQLIPLLAQRALARSEAAVRRGDLGDAEGEATAARHIQPWAASPYLQLALVAEQQGRLARARGRIEQAIARDEGDWRLWLTAARIETKLGEVAQAERSLRRAVELDPRSPLFNGLLGTKRG